MRLCKRAAAVLLVAAMAVSMMTACGTTGGGNDNNGSGSGNNGTSQGGDENTDDKGDNGGNKDDQSNKKDDQDDKKDDQGNSVIPADPEKVTWETSMTKQYFKGISKDNFRISGINNITKELFAYATQGTKQLLAEQEDEKYIFFFTPDGEKLYVTTLEKLPENGIKVNQLTGWKTAEEFGEDMKGSEAEIAKEKARTLARMNELKESIFIADKAPTVFHAENKIMMNTEFYTESMTGVTVEGKTCTYTTVFAKDNFRAKLGTYFYTYRAGDLAFASKQNGDTELAINPTSQISACTDDTFPVIK